jgi:homopolymeric O-antigen transport system ATP-binding protein
MVAKHSLALPASQLTHSIPGSLDALLTLDKVGKDYARISARHARIRLVWQLLRRKAASDIFRAVDGVSFELKRGQSLGVIGENGAGKSTLLKIVAGVIKPTRGTVQVNGRIGALLELGSGFHPEYTGYDNIDLAAALHGITTAEIREHRQAIMDFADLGSHINDPIKTYSSGMVVRLGFAVVTVLRPDVLITDEVLAVGDESFQRKCVTWMEEYLSNGGTLLLCAHSMYHIQKLCTEAIWLKNGSVEQHGDAASVSQAYLAYHEERSARARRAPILALAPEEVESTGVYALRSFEISDKILPEGARFTISGEAYSPDGRPPVILVGIVRADGTPVYGVSTDMDGVIPDRLSFHQFEFAIMFPALTLLPGKYTVRAHALDPEGLRLSDTLEKQLTITGSSREFGLVRIEHFWKAKGQHSTQNEQGTSHRDWPSDR